MPLPWKMAKNARISQFLNDHLHRSRKRRDGSSLFVETGFPTSLVDLFIKNREKLKKPSKKKRQTAPITDPVIAEIPTTPFDSPAIPQFVTGSPSQSPSILVAAGSVDGLIYREVVYETGVDACTVLMVVLKMFLVVGLALGTKRLTVGITISAFLLFFLEYVGKHARALLKPFLEAKFFLKSTVQCVLRSFRLKEDLVSKNDQEVLIQAVECEIQPVNEIIQDQVLWHCEREDPEEVFVIGEEGSSLLKRKSRRAKIKSRMKKLVLKKLRCPRKEQTSKKVEIVGEEEDNIILLCDEYKDESSEISCGSSWRHNEEDDSNNSPTSGKLSESVTRREGKREGFENWGYIVLCMIVLAGLIGGRAFAVILTLSWFLILKLGDKLHIYAVKVPIITKSV